MTDQNSPSTQSISYKDAGVDIDAGNALVERIKGVAKKTRRPEVMAGLGGFGAGYNAGIYIDESNTSINGQNSSVHYGIHGGDGGLLGHMGQGAGGFTSESSAQDETNPGTNYSQYAQSGDGGLPGSAIKGYSASRVTFINTGNVYGDALFKFKA